MGREIRTKNLEIASLKGDLAGEQRLRAAVEVQLQEASSERSEVGRISIVGIKQTACVKYASSDNRRRLKSCIPQERKEHKCSFDRVIVSSTHAALGAQHFFPEVRRVL